MNSRTVKSVITNIFFVLVCASITAPLWVSKEFLFPFVTSKAFVLRIGIELAMPFYLYLVISHKHLRPNLKNWLNIFLLGFVGINWLSAILGVNIYRSLWGNFERMGGALYLTHLALLYFYFLVLGQIGGRYIKRAIQFFLLVAAIIAINGVSGWLGGPTLTLDPSLPGRASSTFGNPIYLGSFLIVPMFLSVFFAMQTQKLGFKIYFWLIALASLLGIYQSGTRGAFVGLLAGVLISFTIFILLTKQKKIRIFGGVIILILAALSLFLFMNAEKLPQGTTLKRVFQLKDSNTQSRILQWQVALKGFKDRPILGTGPENYYIIANEHYNPEIYQFDRSWFDKPHNYLLEILVTSGIIGFAFYAAILVFSILVIFKASTKQFISLFEACLLLAGFLAYQFQNLFVFDTIPASVAFYTLLGFLGYLSFEINFKKNTSDARRREPNQNFAKVVLGISFAFTAYLIYAANWMPAVAARNVNYGYAYASVDQRKAAEYFAATRELPFNFDFSETGSKLSEYAVNLVANLDRNNQEQAVFVKDQVNKVLDYEVKVSRKINNDPVIWQKLSNIYFYKAILDKGSVPFDAIDALEKAIALAPNRVEARLTLAQLRLAQNRPDIAAKILEEAASLDSKYGNTSWYLALVYREEGQKEKALHVAAKALELGYVFKNFEESKWMRDAYMEARAYNEAIKIYEISAKANQLKIDDYIALTELYVKNGEKAKAGILAGEIINLDKSKKPILDEILKGK